MDLIQIETYVIRITALILLILVCWRIILEEIKKIMGRKPEKD